MSFLSEVAEIRSSELIWSAVLGIFGGIRLYPNNEVTHGDIVAMRSRPRHSILLRKLFQSRARVHGGSEIAPGDVDNHLWHKYRRDGQLQGLARMPEGPAEVTPPSRKPSIALFRHVWMLDSPSAGEYGEEGAPENLKRATRVRSRDEVDGLFEFSARWLKNGVGSNRPSADGDDERGEEVEEPKVLGTFAVAYVS